MKIPEHKDFKQSFHDPVWLNVAGSILRRHNISFDPLRRAEQGENIVFLVDNSLVLKIYTPLKNGFDRERGSLEYANGRISIPIPEIIEDGEIEGYLYLVMTQCQGEQMPRDRWLKLEKNVQLRLLTQLAAGLKELHSHDASSYEFDWPEFRQIQIKWALDKQARQQANPEWIASMPAYLEQNLPLIPGNTINTFQHGDVHFGNIRVIETGGRFNLSGLFDFADSIKGFYEYEFVAIGVLMIQGQGDLQREFFRAYGYADHDINETLRRRLMTLTMLYEHSSLRRYAERLRPEAVNYTLDELEKSIWNFV